MKSKKQQEND